MRFKRICRANLKWRVIQRHLKSYHHDERHFIKMEKENSKIRDLLADITKELDHEIHGLKAKLEGQKGDINTQFGELKHHVDAQKNDMKAQYEALQQQLEDIVTEDVVNRLCG
ncbi:hypothetical protein M8C21_022782, partial [Ambrosia artemisiifolia]